MKDGWRTHQQNKLSMGLLAVTLFLGLFAFSANYSTNTVSQEKQVPKTELVVSIKANGKGAASYSKASAQFVQSPIWCDLCQPETLILRFHNQLFKSRLGYPSRQAHCPQQGARFFQRKIFPQNSNEDLSISNRG
jgi:hypothetical protein